MLSPSDVLGLSNPIKRDSKKIMANMPVNRTRFLIKISQVFL